jgi:hypothetical protein
MSRLPTLLAATAALALAGCATEKMRSKSNVLDETLHSYAATIRWGDVAQAQAFIEPKVLAEHPPTPLELERFHQVRITGYDEQPPVPVGDNEVRQTVQIDLVNVNTQTARSVVDHQVWKYDETAKRWWLTSGLPDISRRE